jgi:hypothetical protein
MLLNIRLQRLYNAQNSNLLVQFISYDEKEVLRIRSLAFYVVKMFVFTVKTIPEGVLFLVSAGIVLHN